MKGSPIWLGDFTFVLTQCVKRVIIVIEHMFVKRACLTHNYFLYILSIDSAPFMREVIIIFLSIQSKKKEVVSFLDELHELLTSIDFDMNTDITLISKKKLYDDKHSTPYTLLDLDYDVLDVVERLKELKVKEYSETKIDRDDLEPPLLFVFGKIINGKLVYIKLKIKGNQKRRIICVSFHYVKNTMNFPYA